MNDIYKTNLLKKYLETDNFDLEDYLVFNDKQATKYCKECILETLWAFNTDFIASFLDLNNWEYNSFIKNFKKLQSEICEDCNIIVKKLLGNKLNEFIKEAIKIDGRGHFVSSYDGIENKFYYNRTYYYIYKIN